MRLHIPYWPLLLGPTLALWLGFVLNAFVVGINHGQMPVLVPGGCSSPMVGGIHACMTYGTHLKVLADWIIIPTFGMASPGDFLEFLYSYTAIPALVAWAALMIRDRQEEKNPWGPHRQ